MPWVVYMAFDANEAVQVYPIGLGVTLPTLDPLFPGHLNSQLTTLKNGGCA